MKVRGASGDDAAAIAEIHVRSWQAAYRGVLPDELLDSLSVSERETSWRALLSGSEDRQVTLVAEHDGGDGSWSRRVSKSWRSAVGDRSSGCTGRKETGEGVERRPGCGRSGYPGSQSLTIRPAGPICIAASFRRAARCPSRSGGPPRGRNEPVAPAQFLPCHRSFRQALLARRTLP